MAHRVALVLLVLLFYSTATTTQCRSPSRQPGASQKVAK